VRPAEVAFGRCGDGGIPPGPDILDRKEQRCHRPEGYAEQKPYDSGKKGCPTLPTQVGSDPAGRIEGGSDSVPGGANHDRRVLRSSGVLERLGEGEGARRDTPASATTSPRYRSSCRFRRRAAARSPRAYHRVVASHRVVVERTMAPLNRFTVVRQVFRAPKRERHGTVVRVVATRVNRRIAGRPLKTYAA
jgi:hypothetical protein